MRSIFLPTRPNNCIKDVSALERIHLRGVSALYFFYYIPVGIDAKLRKFPIMTYFFSLLCVTVFIVNRYFADLFPLDIFNLIYSHEDANLLSMIASAFVHFGYVHLIGNLVYLFVFGRYIEDRMGAFLYTLLFISSSAVGNALQGQFNLQVLHNGYIGIIGASGAVAGILGVYTVRFYSSRMRIAYWVFMPLQAYTRMGRVEIPALLAVALWFVLQTVQGMLQAGGISMNVAYVTHLSGFLWGMGVAVVLGEHRRAVVENLWRRAQRYLEKGEAFAAQGELIKYIALKPDDDNAHPVLARAMAMSGDKNGALQNYRKACEQLLASKKRGAAERLFGEALRGFPDFTISPEAHLNLAFGLERNLKPKLATKAYENFGLRYPIHKEAPFSILRRANLLWNTFGKKDEAVSCYRDLIRRYPEDEWVDFAKEQVRLFSLGAV